MIKGCTKTYHNHKRSNHEVLENCIFWYFTCSLYPLHVFIFPFDISELCCIVSNITLIFISPEKLIHLTEYCTHLMENNILVRVLVVNLLSQNKIIIETPCKNNDWVVKTDKKFERFEEFSIYTKSTMYTVKKIQTQLKKYNLSISSQHKI